MIFCHIYFYHRGGWKSLGVQCPKMNLKMKNFFSFLFSDAKCRVDQLLGWYVSTSKLIVCKVTWTCVLFYFFKPSLDNYITKGETLSVVDFWKMSWHNSCTLNRTKCKYADVYTCVSIMCCEKNRVLFESFPSPFFDCYYPSSWTACVCFVYVGDEPMFVRTCWGTAAPTFSVVMVTAAGAALLTIPS